MTVLTGIPTLPGATVRVRVDGPFYQRGDAADPGRHTGIWDGTAYKDDAGNTIELIMPRKDQGDPMISGDVKIYLSYVFASGRDFTQTLTYRPLYWVETTPGFLDLSKNADPDVPQIATAEQLQRLSTLLDEGQALNAESTRLQADIAQTGADNTAMTLQAAGVATDAATVTKWLNGDHNTLPANVVGIWRIMTGTERGQVWRRDAAGGALTRDQLFELITPQTVAFPNVPNFAVRDEVQVRNAGGVQTQMAYTAEAFGMRANASTDNRDALQLALDSGENLVFAALGKQEYNVDGFVDRAGLSDVTIEFRGQSYLRQRTAQTRILKLDDAQNVRIINPRMRALAEADSEWTGTSANGGRLLWLEGGKSIEIIGGKLRGGGYANLYAHSVEDLTIERVEFIAPDGIDGTRGDGNYQFNCIVSSNWADEGKPGLVIRHCVSRRGGQNFYVGPGYVGAQLVGNRAYDARGQHNFYLNPADDMYIAANYGIGSRYLGMKLQASVANNGGVNHDQPVTFRNVQIVDNVFRDCGQQALIMSQGDTPGQVLSGVVTQAHLYVAPIISRNTMQNTHGMILEDARDVCAEGNVITDANLYALGLNNITGRVQVQIRRSAYAAVRALQPVAGGRLELDLDVVGANLLDAADAEAKPMIRVDNTGQTVKLSGRVDRGAGTFGTYAALINGGSVEITDFTLASPMKADGSAFLVRLDAPAVLSELNNVDMFTWHATPAIPASGLKGRGFKEVSAPGAVFPANYYPVGATCRNSTPTAGGVYRNIITTAGYTGYPQWQANTAYAVGTIVWNGTSRIYRAKVAGVSGSAAPTNAPGDVVDGTVTWAYLSAPAVFKALDTVSA